ncbi:MAG: redoxin domain-containing protein [Bacteroidota bacterium]
MKYISVFLATIFIAICMEAQNSSLLYAELKTIDGLPTSSEEIIEAGVVTILVFWKTCNKDCRANLDALHEAWQEELEPRGVKMVAICVDGTGSLDHVKPLVYGNRWEFDTYVDVNCELKRAMNVNTVPCTLLFDDARQIICRHDGFCTGSEAILCEKIQGRAIAALD